MERVAALLIAAHVLGDFLLQTDGLVRRKGDLRFLLFHAGIHAGLTYALLQAWACWQLPLAVFLGHALVDYIKQRSGRDGATAFAIDQAVHLGGLLILAWLSVELGWLSGFFGKGYQVVVATAGFVATVRGAGILIAKFARRLTQENELKLDGLVNGGKLIGQLERVLIFLFIFIHQPAGIGFLVAAKSILRFEEAKKQKLAEYVLIGTLLSFSLAVALASATKWAMKR